MERNENRSERSTGIISGEQAYPVKSEIKRLKVKRKMILKEFLNDSGFGHSERRGKRFSILLFNSKKILNVQNLNIPVKRGDVVIVEG